MNKRISAIALVAALIGGIFGYEIRGIVAHYEQAASQQAAKAIITAPAKIGPW